MDVDDDEIEHEIERYADMIGRPALKFDTEVSRAVTLMVENGGRVRPSVRTVIGDLVDREPPPVRKGPKTKDPALYNPPRRRSG